MTFGAEHYAFPPREIISAPIHGESNRFPIRRIYCVGRNYAAHVREMGGDERDVPLFFVKDADAYAPDGSVIPYPPHTKNYHHEVELVVAIGKEGFEIPSAEAETHIFGYAIGLDMTRRDLQAAAQKAARPWCEAKNFPFGAPMGQVHRIAQTGALKEGVIALSVNGETRQAADLNQMIWSVGEIISELSKSYQLLPGDLIFTGTPEGVGPVAPGDRLEGRIAGLGELRVTIGEPRR